MSKKLIDLVWFLFVVCMGLSQAHVQAGLVAYWKLDESSGTIAADTAGGDNDGMLYGNLEWRPGEGKEGGAIFYSRYGNTARVEIPTTGMSASEGTMMIWGNLAGPYPTNRVDASYFFGHTTRPPYANRIQLYMDGDDTILDLGLGNSHTRRTGIKRLQTRIWHHVALTWDSGGYVVYVDGEKITEGSYTGLTALHNFMDIGNDGNPSQGTEAFAGLLDEVRLYDHALTADEIRTAMDSDVSLQASWPSPSDGASHPRTWVTLSWMAGDSAVSHDVYFGDHFDHVNAGTGDTFRGNQTSTEYVAGLPGSAYPDGLVPDTTYYWRIDEVEADGVTRHRGMVWSFFVPFVEANLSAVPTFHCIGIYWSPQDGRSDNVCQVHYRSVGSANWKEALPLWYDDRGVGGYAPGYRGSIVNLDPGTLYEIKLELLDTGTEGEFIAETWSEDFPVAQTVYLPAGTTNRPLEITESGSPDGYILYTHPEGESSTIDVSNQEDSCIYVSASYIIIRGLTLRDASIHGIRILNNVHDVVIEECDISGWGRLQEGEWGHNNDAAVFSDSPNIERIIVQRNKLHHPRPDTNSWKEPARTIPINTHHPMGPQAITFKPRNERAGHFVIRYNEIYSDEDHYYNDCMGETKNFSYTGFPIRDTDIYGNYVANCWDDGIEVEGANCNVRIWGNYITETAIKIATQSVSVGPLYIWRNVFGISRVGPNDNYGWRAFKSGDVQGWGGGKTYIFHNTILQPPPPDHGSRHGINAHDAGLTNTCTRNNVFHVPSNDRYSIFNPSPNSTNDFDYDLFNGNINAYRGAERNGIQGVPIYDLNNGDGEFALDPFSPGYDAGVVIPNFNDNYNGAAPDIGAHEAGSPPMEFGVDAYE
ncbi:LamG-like jellyroll fold domain-containing protein [Planctomycetota bacterium]